MTIARERLPTRRATYRLLAGLYVGQWLAPSFLGSGGLLTILYQRGVSLEQLGAFQALIIVGPAKVLWAPLVDRFGSTRSGHYRSWLLVVQPAMVLAALVLLPLDPVADLGVVFVITIVMWVLMGAQDVATDALAFRLLDSTGRGVANGIQTAAGFVGAALGSGAVLLVYDVAGWTAAVLTLTVATAIPAVQVARLREPRAPRQAPPGFPVLASLFRQPGVARWALVVLPLTWAGIGGYFALLNPMLVDAGWSVSRIGLVTTVFGGMFAIAGALGAGSVLSRIGRRRALLLFGVGQLAAVPAFYGLAHGHAPLVTTSVLICVVHLVYAAAVTTASCTKTTSHVASSRGAMIAGVIDRLTSSVQADYTLGRYEQERTG
ncbi:hypothetical protein ALI22I_07530 [Saccharothrix sp. ALI-22-I]|uniref:MFS transporter n=1 Tax=Saccharothrix sp. ALI-22-I TaxID=1933778 RepID=UPI00097C7E2F|nr:MFS transporter [Saccharothrix sp. ALI-22-I]ONI91713.1 hypothetical protein ALI22I_07530 [Saccharothrix sp. ALI-22-I]